MCRICPKDELRFLDEAMRFHYNFLFFNYLNTHHSLIMQISNDVFLIVLIMAHH